jgi:sugar lactone lactonase YvrE
MQSRIVTGLALLVFIASDTGALLATQERLEAAAVETLTGELDGGTGGISVDRDGNIYVADFGSRLSGGGTVGSKVFVVSPAGEVRIFAEGFRGASGNEFDSQGNFFQSNVSASVISKVTPGGEMTTFASQGIATPVGIVSDEEDNLYVANCGSNSIQMVTPEGDSERFVWSGLLNCPNGIVFDDHGNLYVANFGNGGVIKITPDKQVREIAALPGNNNGHLVHHDGFLYVIDRGGHQVYSVSLDGEVELFAGSGSRGREDGDPLEATFSYPNDIGISPDGKTFYVNEVAGDTGPHTVLAPMVVRAIRVRD